MPDEINQSVEETQEHVENAVEQVSDAVKTAPNAGIEDLLKAVKDTLQGVQAELKRANDAREETAHVEEPATPVEPDVEVEVPKPQERKVRRGGRKVTKRG